MSDLLAHHLDCPACGAQGGAVRTHWCSAALRVVSRKPTAAQIRAAWELQRPLTPPQPVEDIGDVPW